MERSKSMNLIPHTSFILCVFFLFFISINANAQKKWDGGAATNNWHDGDNWKPNGIPSTTDKVTLDHSQLASNYTINISDDAVNIEKFKINATAANITLNVGQNMTITQGEFSLESDAGHTATLDINANITVSGGSGPEPQFGTKPSFGDKIINANSGTIQVDRDIKFDPNTTYNSGTEIWRFQGGENSEIKTADPLTINQLELNKSDASKTLKLDTDLTISDDLNVQSGIVNVEKDLVINGNTNIQASGVLKDDTNTGDISFEGDTDVQGVLKTGSSSNVYFLGDLTSTGSADIDIIGGGNVFFETNNLTISNSSSNPLLFDKEVIVDINTTLVGNKEITFDKKLTINSGITLTNENTDFVKVKSDLSAASGTIINGDNAVLDISTNVISLGTLDAYTHGGNAIHYTSTTNQNIITADYQNLRVKNGGTKSLSGAILVNDLFINTGATFDVTTNDYELTIGDDLKNDGTFNAQMGTVTFSGTLGQHIDGSSATTFYNLEVNKSGNQLELHQNTQISHNLTISNGEFDLRDKNLTVDGVTSIENTSSLVKTVDGGTQIFKGQVSIAIGATFEDNSSGTTALRFEGGIDNSGTVDLKRTLFQANTQTYTPQNTSTNNIDLAQVQVDFIIANGSGTQIDQITTSGITFTNQNQTGLTVTNSFTGSATFINGENAKFFYEGLTDLAVSNVNFAAANNQVIYSADGVQNIRSTDYHHLELQGTGDIDTKSLTANTTVNGNLIINNQARLDAQTFNLSVGGNLTNHEDFTNTSGNLTINDDLENNASFSHASGSITIGDDFLNNGTFNVSSGTLTISDDLENSGTFSASSHTTIFNSTTDPSITGTSTLTTFDQLTINSSSTVDANMNISAAKINLTNGHFRLNNVELKLTSTSPISGGSATSYIITNSGSKVTRQVSSSISPCLFPVGNGGYSPVTLSISAAGTTNISVSTQNTFLNIPATVNDYVKRNWIIVPDTDVSGVDIIFKWSNTDVEGVLDATDMKAYRYDGSQWIEAGQDGVDLTSRNLNLTDVSLQNTSFTRYAISSTEIVATHPEATQITSFTVAPNSTSLQVNWSEIWNADSYDIQVSYDINFNTLFVNDNTSELFYDIAKISPNDILYIRIKSRNGIGESEFSEPFTITVPDPLPPTPQNYHARIIERQNASLEWEDVSFNETGFIIERAIDFEDFVIIDTIYAESNTGELVYMEENLAFNQTYFYRITAYNEFGNSEPTETIGLIPGSNNVTANEDLINISQELHVYPNPSRGNLYIDYVSQSTVLPVSIWSLDGQMIWQQELIYHPNQQELHLEHLVAGSYLLVIEDKEKTVSQRIVIVN